VRAPYGSLIADPGFRWLTVSGLISGVGDGITVVAVPWLALRLAQSQGIEEGLAVAAAAVAGTLTGVPLALAAGFGRFNFNPRSMMLLDTVIRSALFLVMAGLVVADQLPLWLYIVLLGCSALLHTVATSARRLIMTDLGGSDQRLAVNSLITTQQSIGEWTLGPALGGVLVAGLGPATALAANGLSFLPLLIATLRVPGDAGRFGVKTARRVRRSGWRLLRRRPAVLGLLLLALGVDGLYYPVEVALPIHVAHTFGGAAVLGAVWAGFGIGAVIGSVLTGLLSRLSQSAVLVAATVGWAAALAGFTASRSPWLAIVSFAVGGLLWAPFNPVAVSLVQAAVNVQDQQSMIALWTAALQAIAPFGLAASGPFVATLGASNTLWWSAGATAALALLACAVTISRRMSRSLTDVEGPAR
jgi:predicted MFS family arabinose efflux permease